MAETSSMVSVLRRMPNCLGASGCSFAIASGGRGWSVAGDSTHSSRHEITHCEPLLVLKKYARGKDFLMSTANPLSNHGGLI